MAEQSSDTRTSHPATNLKRKYGEMLNQPDSSERSKIFVGIKNDLDQEEQLKVCSVSELIAKQLKKNVNQDTNPTVIIAASTAHNENVASSSKIANMIENGNYYESQAINCKSTESNLQSINEDCFRQIVRYLNIIDVTNLAATCTQLLNFAEAIVFPKKAKNIYIKIFSEMKVYLTSPSSNSHTLAMPLKNLETSISFFGKIVENLTFLCFKCDSEEQSEIERSLAIIIEHCKNLTALHFYCDFQPFTAVQTYEFKGRIEMLQNLKELQLCGCPGITSNWPTSLASSSKLEKLTLIGKNEFSDNFFDYFSNLLCLNVVLLNSDWQVNDIAKIFDKTGHSLKQLTLRHLVQGYETVGVLITEKLPKLESLELSFELTDDTEYMISLPQLKSLTIFCDEGKSINALLLKLSDNGIVDKMRINGGFFDVEEENALPLTFHKLQSFDWARKGNISHFLTAMTRAEMPAIHSIGLNRIKAEETNGVLKLLQSKKTLKNVDLTFDMNFIPFSFWQQLIGILKEPCVPKRPLLNFVTSENLLKKEDVSKIVIVGSIYNKQFFFISRLIF